MTQPGSVIPPQPGWWVRTDRIGVNGSEYGWTAAIAGPAAGVASGGFGWASDGAGHETPWILSEIVAEVETSTAILNLHPAKIAETVSETAHVNAVLNSHRKIGAAPTATASVTSNLARAAHAAVSKTITATVTAALTKITPPAYDSGALSSYELAVSSGTAFTFTQTAAAGTYVIVTVYGNSSIGSLATSIVAKFGTVTLTSLGNVSLNNNAASGWIWAFGGFVSGSGSQTVSVTVNTSGSPFFGYATSDTYKNVTSVGTLQKAFGNSSSSPSVSVSSASGNVVWGAIAGQAGGDTFSSFSLTQRQTQNSNAPTLVTGDKAGAATVVVSAGLGDSWAALGLNML